MSCSLLPLRHSEQILSLSSMSFKHVSFGIIEGPLILGIISTVIVIAALHHSFWKEEPPSGPALPLDLILGGVGSSICVLSFMLPAIILLALYSKARNLPSGISVEEGRFFNNSIAIFCIAIVMAICMFSVCLRRYMLHSSR